MQHTHAFSLSLAPTCYDEPRRGRAEKEGLGRPGQVDRDVEVAVRPSPSRLLSAFSNRCELCLLLLAMRANPTSAGCTRSAHTKHFLTKLVDSDPN